MDNQNQEHNLQNLKNLLTSNWKETFHLNLKHWFILVGSLFIIGFSYFFSQNSPFTQSKVIPIEIRSFFLQFSLNLFTIFTYFANFIIIIYASIRIIKISKEKNAAEDLESREPRYIVQNGNYASVRHPMYGMFILNIWAIFGLLHSVFGFILAILFTIIQLGNGILEEINYLLPKFQNAYSDYMRKVPNRYLSQFHKVILLDLLVLSLLQIFF